MLRLKTLWKRLQIKLKTEDVEEAGEANGLQVSYLLLRQICLNKSSY